MNPPRISLLILLWALKQAGCTRGTEGAQPVHSSNWSAIRHPARESPPGSSFRAGPSSKSPPPMPSRKMAASMSSTGATTLSWGCRKEVKGRPYFNADDPQPQWSAPSALSMAAITSLPWTRTTAGPDLGPHPEYFWILARQPQQLAEVLDDLLDKARSATASMPAP